MGIGYIYLMSVVFSFCVYKSSVAFFEMDGVIEKDFSSNFSSFITSIIPIVNIILSLSMFKAAIFCHYKKEEREKYKKMIKEYFDFFEEKKKNEEE